MPYELEGRLVVGLASSALFDLSESDAVFREKGEHEYREYQERLLDTPLEPGVAFPFVKRLLSFNALADSPVEDPLVEVILLSRNDPDTGLRVMRSIQHHGLQITRAVFMQGRSPYRFIPAFGISLFLSANQGDVKEAIKQGFPAGQVLPHPTRSFEEEEGLRIALDFDGVVIDDAPESIYRAVGPSGFHEHEALNIAKPHDAGPLAMFLRSLRTIQDAEERRKASDKSYTNRLHVAIVTARNAPSHERAVNTLKSWGVRVNDAFFLGGVEKKRVLEVLRPHIFFDDQQGHLEGASEVVPSVHVPFGIANAESSP